MSDASRAEICAVAVAEAFRGDGEILASSFGTVPAVGARLARLTFEPDLLMTDGVATLLESVGSDRITRGGGGADIGPLMQTGVPGMGLNVDGTRYFWYHHTDADTIDKLDPDEVALCVAAMAVIAYVVADMPETLPR